MRHTCGVQELCFPQDPDAFPLSHARGSHPRWVDPKGLPSEFGLGATHPVRPPLDLSFFGQEAVRFIVI